MSKINNLHDMKNKFQAVLENDKKELEKLGIGNNIQIKSYLIESNISPSEAGCPLGVWKKFENKGWYKNIDSKHPESLILDATNERVWTIYSLLNVEFSDKTIEKWIRNRIGLDRCWLTRNQLIHWEKKDNWLQRGLGIKYLDSLSPEIDAGYLSLKLWYRSQNTPQGFNELLKAAKDNFAIHSARWEKRIGDKVEISTEWYTNGKLTIQTASNIDDILYLVLETANIYQDSLIEATNLRENKLGAFELEFSQEINLDAFSESTSKGRRDLNLWLTEVDSDDNFKRFSGVDLHTWDRIIISMGLDYAHLTIPGNGCVNAAPRIATKHGENNAGNAKITYDGVDLFV